MNPGIAWLAGWEICARRWHLRAIVGGSETEEDVGSRNAIVPIEKVERFSSYEVGKQSDSGNRVLLRSEKPPTRLSSSEIVAKGDKLTSKTTRFRKSSEGNDFA